MKKIKYLIFFIILNIGQESKVKGGGLKNGLILNVWCVIIYIENGIV
jgi:hypothetical protein